MEDLKNCPECESTAVKEKLIFKHECSWRFDYHCKCGSGPSRNEIIQKTFLLTVDEPEHLDYDSYLNCGSHNIDDVGANGNNVRLEEIKELYRDDCLSDGCSCLWETPLEDIEVKINLSKEPYSRSLVKVIDPEEVIEHFGLDRDDDLEDYLKEYIEEMFLKEELYQEAKEEDEGEISIEEVEWINDKKEEKSSEESKKDDTTSNQWKFYECDETDFEYRSYDIETIISCANCNFETTMNRD